VIVVHFSGLRVETILLTFAFLACKRKGKKEEKRRKMK